MLNCENCALTVGPKELNMGSGTNGLGICNGLLTRTLLDSLVVVIIDSSLEKEHERIWSSPCSIRLPPYSHQLQQALADNTRSTLTDRAQGHWVAAHSTTAAQAASKEHTQETYKY